MSVVRNTLGLVVSNLRQKGPHPNTANEVAIEVIPTVERMAEALREVTENLIVGDTTIGRNCAAALAQYENGLAKQAATGETA
jgi:hypothetical protein